MRRIEPGPRLPPLVFLFFSVDGLPSLLITFFFWPALCHYYPQLAPSHGHIVIGNGFVPKLYSTVAFCVKRIIMDDYIALRLKTPYHIFWIQGSTNCQDGSHNVNSRAPQLSAPVPASRSMGINEKAMTTFWHLYIHVQALDPRCLVKRRCTYIHTCDICQAPLLTEINGGIIRVCQQIFCPFTLTED